MTPRGWVFLAVGGRSTRDPAIRSDVLALLHRAGMVPQTMTLREEDGPMPFDLQVATESTSGCVQLTGGQGSFDARFWLGDRPQFRLRVPDLATVDALGDPLAIVLLPDLMWAWPELTASEDPRLLDHVASVGPVTGESGFGGWGWRTWFRPASSPLTVEPAEPVTVHNVGADLVRVDLSPDLLDDEQVLRGAAVLARAGTAVAATNETSGPAVSMSSAELESRAMVGAVLDAVEVRDADLRSRGLSRSQWRASVLIDCDFDDADLAGACFDGARLDQVSLRGCDLTEASLVATDLVSSFLEDAQLERADLKGAALYNCELARARCRGATFEAALLEDCRLTGADLADVSFERATLRRCDLRDTDLSRVNLENAVLEDCLPNLRG